jgi:hypothetical protein
MIGYSGINCLDCTAFQGTVKGDEERLGHALARHAGHAARGERQDGGVALQGRQVKKQPKLRAPLSIVERERAAYHEAGHCVMARLLKRGFYLATIMPHKRRAGAVFRRRGEEDPTTREGRRRISDEALVNVTGPVAETRRLSGPVNVDGASSDLAKFEKLAVSLYSDQGEQFAFLGRKLRQARNRLSAPMVWARVEAVADGLLKYGSLGQAQVHRLCREVLAKGGKP